MLNFNFPTIFLRVSHFFWGECKKYDPKIKKNAEHFSIAIFWVFSQFSAVKRIFAVHSPLGNGLDPGNDDDRVKGK